MSAVPYGRCALRLAPRLPLAGGERPPNVTRLDWGNRGMAAIDLKALVGRLNEPCRRALEAAAGLTLSRTHYNVEIEHWLLKLADASDGDFAAILRHYEVDQGRLLVDLNRALDHMKTGNARAPSLSPEIVELGKEAWLMASLEHGLGKLRSGHLLWALVADESL